MGNGKLRITNNSLESIRNTKKYYEFLRIITNCSELQQIHACRFTVIEQGPLAIFQNY